METVITIQDSDSRYLTVVVCEGFTGSGVRNCFGGGEEVEGYKLSV